MLEVPWQKIKNTKMKLSMYYFPLAEIYLYFFPRKYFWITSATNGYYAVKFSTSSKFFALENSFKLSLWIYFW